MTKLEIKTILCGFWNDQNGGEVVEYALVIGVLVVVGIVTLVISIRNGASSKFNNISTVLQNT